MLQHVDSIQSFVKLWNSKGQPNQKIENISTHFPTFKSFFSTESPIDQNDCDRDLHIDCAISVMQFPRINLEFLRTMEQSRHACKLFLLLLWLSSWMDQSEVRPQSFHFHCDRFSNFKFVGILQMKSIALVTSLSGLDKHLQFFLKNIKNFTWKKQCFFRFLWIFFWFYKLFCQPWRLLVKLTRL